MGVPKSDPADCSPPPSVWPKSTRRGGECALSKERGYASEEETEEKTSNESQDEEEQAGQEANSKLLQQLMDKEHKRYRKVERASKRARTEKGLFE